MTLAGARRSVVARTPEPVAAGTGPGAWSSYLAGFHARRPGITEDVLSRSRSRGGLNPYQWVTAPVPLGRRALDLACGSGPSLRLREREPWIGVDRSEGELVRARLAGSDNVVRGDATLLPFDDGVFDCVVCSMALMLFEPLPVALDEVARVLRGGGLLVVTLPGRWPLRPADVARYARLVLALRKGRLRYPNDRLLARAPSVLGARGFTLLEDRRIRFGFPIGAREDAVTFVRSLYLPDVDGEVIERAEAIAMTWVGCEIGIPLRRLVLRRASVTA
jgi:SAM-dependent methyltransferase